MLRVYKSFGVTLSLAALLLVLLGTGAIQAKEVKVPITTSSDKARQLYLEGRDLAEKLRAQAARAYFESAIAEDSNFALAYLNLSFTQPTISGFLTLLNKAMALRNNVSEGEQLMILAVQAGNNADPMGQRKLYRKLVADYPKDERALNLLANNYFGMQDYTAAIEYYNKAIAVNPEFSQPYNQLGYAYRFLGNYDDAEKAFKKYIELIPDDPNPYDSYAELLLKTGKYEESIANYRKALQVDSSFAASYLGIATNLNMMGEYAKARAELQVLYDQALDDGQRRAALFAIAVSYVDEGDMTRALDALQRQYAIAEKSKDAPAMANDLVVMGNILIEAGQYDKALAKFDQSLETMEKADVSDELKKNAQRFYLNNGARVAMHKGDFATAKANAAEYLKRVETINNPFQIRLAHGLIGMIALAEKDYTKALAELRLANQQDPYNFFRMAQAYQGLGQTAEAREMYKKAAYYNVANNINYSFVRHQAAKALAEM